MSDTKKRGAPKSADPRTVTRVCLSNSERVMITRDAQIDGRTVSAYMRWCALHVSKTVIATATVTEGSK